MKVLAETLMFVPKHGNGYGLPEEQALDVSRRATPRGSCIASTLGPHIRMDDSSRSRALISRDCGCGPVRSEGCSHETLGFDCTLGLFVDLVGRYRNGCSRTAFFCAGVSLFYTLFLMLDHCVWADVKVGNEHLRLFAEHNAQGVQESVYNVISKTWIAPSESVDDIEQGKERAAAHAQEYLRGLQGWNCRHCDGKHRDQPEHHGAVRRRFNNQITRPPI